MGRYVLPTRHEYEGEWKNDEPNGKGKKTWPNGDTYEGECPGGANHESVQLIDSLVEGSFVDDMREGFGKYCHPDGYEYEGEWKNNKPNGKGKEK